MTDNETIRFPNIPGISPATVKLIEKLKEGKVGDTVSDEELSKICGRATHVTGNGYANLQTAIRYCLRHYGKSWSRVKTEGRIKCEDTDERIEHVVSDNNRIRRSAARSTQRLVSIPDDEITDTQRPRVFGMLAQAGAIKLFAQNSTAKRLATKHDERKMEPKQLLDRLLLDSE